MNILLISESYKPLISGTINYAENISRQLSKYHNIVHVFPGISDSIFFEGNVKCISININSDSYNISRKQSYDFVYKINLRLENYIKEFKIEIVHVLSGWSILEKLNLNTLKKYKIGSVITLHNIPPKECSNSWKGDIFFRYLVDLLKKEIVRTEAIYRLYNNVFDLYIVPSEDVQNSLKRVFFLKKSIVIPHGIDNRINKYLSSPKKHTNNQKLILLTVGGIVPHKNQLLIPKIAKILESLKIEFQWHIVGPIRNRHYFNKLISSIEINNLLNKIFVHNNLPEKDLYELYKLADIYIQPSKEEGFCFTALDALAFGIPIIGTDTGEIKNFTKYSNGYLVGEDIVLSTSTSILSIINRIEHKTNIQALNYTDKYNWEKIVLKLNYIYSRLMK